MLLVRLFDAIGLFCIVYILAVNQEKPLSIKEGYCCSKHFKTIICPKMFHWSFKQTNSAF